MNKKKIKIIVLFILMLFVGCILRYSQLRYGSYLKNKQMGLEIVGEKVSSVECTIAVTSKAKQGTEGLYISGIYAIEKLTVWGWKELEYAQGKGYFYSGNEVPLDITKEQQVYVNWLNNYGELKKGTYRMKLFIYKDGDMPTLEQQEEKCYFIFRVNACSKVPQIPNE